MLSLPPDRRRSQRNPLLAWISGLQNPDGSLGLDPIHRDQGLWLTALSAVIFHHCGPKDARDRALGFVASFRSVTMANDPNVRQDNTIVGWPWVRDTFGWVEPTAWSVIALNVCGRGDDSRAVEGRRFLLDRRIPSGGWNYGNPGINDRELLPFWDTTGLALIALRGQTEAVSAPASTSSKKNRKRSNPSAVSPGRSWASKGAGAMPPG